MKKPLKLLALSLALTTLFSASACALGDGSSESGSSQTQSSQQGSSDTGSIDTGSTDNSSDSPSAGSSDSSSSGETTPTPQYISVTGDGVRIRDAANLESNTLSYAYSGDVFETTGEENGFYQIVYDGGVGYISKSYSAPYEGTVEDDNETPVTPPTSADKIIVTGSSVNIRSEANTNCTVLGSAAAGDKFTLLETLDGWYKIEYNSSIAYISASYSEPYHSSNDEVDQNATLVRCLAYGQAIRASASSDSTKLGTACAGQKLTWVETLTNWFKVEYNGGYGYISRTHAKIEENKIAKSKDYLVQCTQAGVNIRAGAGTGYASKGTTTAANIAYYWLETVGDWHKIYYRNQIAYIHSSYTTKISINTSDNPDIEKVIMEGYKTMGTPYVWGATRYHGGLGGRFEGFSTDAFDCSALVQYMFYVGAKVCMGMNTTDQHTQGLAVSGSLERGDVMFFATGSSSTAITHVGVYLGDGYMLHTYNTSVNACVMKYEGNSYWTGNYRLSRRFI